MTRKLLESIPYEGMKNGTHLDVEVNYSKASFGSQRRGFYLSVTPVTRGNGIKSVVLLTGTRALILETNRFSEKQMDKAIELSRGMKDELISYVLTQERAA